MSNEDIKIKVTTFEYTKLKGYASIEKIISNYEKSNFK
jgi:hypothetical protein